MSNSNNFHVCKICGRRLKSWKSIQRGVGATCENKYLNNLYKKQQLTIDSIVNEAPKKGSRCDEGK